MGFMDTLGRIYEGAANKAEAFNDKVNQYMERYDRLSDEELIRVYKTVHSTAERVACSQLLKERGYLRNQD